MLLHCRPVCDIVALLILFILWDIEMSEVCLVTPYAHPVSFCLCYIYVLYLFMYTSQIGDCVSSLWRETFLKKVITGAVLLLDSICFCCCHHHYHAFWNVYTIQTWLEFPGWETGILRFQYVTVICCTTVLKYAIVPKLYAISNIWLLQHLISNISDIWLLS